MSAPDVDYRDTYKWRKRNSSYRDRKGGIDPKVFRELSKKDRKEYAKEGLVGDRAKWLLTGDMRDARDDAGYYKKTGQDKWEQAAWEMGFGNIKDVDDLKKLYRNKQEFGFNNFNSMQDVKQFDKTSKKSIDKSIEKAMNKRWDKFLKDKEGEASDGTDGHDPQELDSGGWDSPYADMLTQMMGMINNQNSAYVQGSRPGWAPRGGW